MKPLNKNFAPKSVMPEKVIEFGEGNFLRAFVDWIIWNMNQKTDFNGSVVVVQPIERGMVDWLNGQDCLYHVNLQGRENGKPVNTLERIDCISRALNPYTQNQAFMALADQPEIRFVISNTTEAGIAFDPSCKLDDAPASSYPGKLVQLLYRRWQTFNGDPTKGLIIFPCELIFLNGHVLKDCIYKYIELWQLPTAFKEWFENSCGVYATLVDRIVPGFPRKEIAEIQEKISYRDNLVVQAETFHLWVIEAPKEVANEFPADKAGLYVLTGGELAAAVMADAIVRVVPGVIGDEQSALSDCFQDDLLSAPIYTRPADYKGWKVPDILLSGNEAKIKQWEMDQAMERTRRLRPDLLK